MHSDKLSGFSESQATGTSAPAQDLADVWQLLDVLPVISTPVDLAATTVELVAARAAADTSPRDRGSVLRARRLWPLLAVAVGLVAGVVAGRLTAPDPDRLILEHLPLVEHLGLLQEAGSVEFLEQFAGRMETGQGPSSRWFGLSRDPIALRAEAQDFTTELERLQSQRDAATFGSDFLARRRGRVASLGDTELAALEKSAATFESLAAVDRRTLARLATALADPAATSLHDAARLWHLIIAATNPAFRRNMIEMPTAERLEWLSRGAARFDPRLPGRSREDDRGGERRPSGQRREGMDRSWNGSRQPPFPQPPYPQFTPGGPNPGLPAPQSGWPSLRGPAASRPAGPREAPAETQAPPG